MSKENITQCSNFRNEPRVLNLLYDVASDGLSVEERNNELERLKKKREELLISAGYYVDEKGNVDKLDNIILDGILGFAIGDALGVPVEFFSRERLTNSPLRAMIGFGTHSVSAGTWSDDTSMVLATVDSIIENSKLDFYDIMTKFNEWYSRAKYTATNCFFDIGKTTKDALESFVIGVDPLKCGNKDIDSNGNGSLMRILPIAYYLYYNYFSEEEEVQIINAVSSLTHGHEISCLGCKIYSDYIKLLLDGVDKYDALINLRNKSYNKYYSEASINRYKRILVDDLSVLDKNEISSLGFVVDTLEASLWCVLNSNNYKDAVLTAVNLGIDTDTIGAITGSFAGIIYGKEQIPQRWLNKLKKREYIEEIANKFAFTLNNISKNKTR